MCKNLAKKKKKKKKTITNKNEAIEVQDEKTVWKSEETVR